MADLVNTIVKNIDAHSLIKIDAFNYACLIKVAIGIYNDFMKTNVSVDDHPIKCAIKLNELNKRSHFADQRSAEWKQQRHSYITGSAVAHAAGIMGAVARQNLLLEKASTGQFSSFFGNIYTHFGNMMEPVTNAIYCHKNSTQIREYGLIEHKDIKFLGASTDGVTNELRNIEIKSLASRQIDGKIKKEYMMQMQMQMQCLGLEVTDFIEARYAIFDTYNGKAKYNGSIIETCLPNGEHYYYYSPLMLTQELLNEWIDTQTHEAIKAGNIYIRTIYWDLAKYSCIVVNRDKNWLKTYKKPLEDFWNEVLYLRENPAALTDKLDQEVQRKARKNPDKFVLHI